MSLLDIPGVRGIMTPDFIKKIAEREGLKPITVPHDFVGPVRPGTVRLPPIHANEPTTTQNVPVKGAAGGGLVMGGVHLPSNVEEFVGSTLLTPAVGGAGTLIGGGTRIITKTGSKFLLPGLAAAAGFLGGLLFGGGGSQTQDQAIDQAPVITPTQTTDVSPTMKTLLDIINRLSQQQTQEGGDIDLGPGTYDIGGGIGSPIQTETTYNITAPYTYNIQNTITKTIQRTSSYVGATQEATQEKGLDLLSLAILGGVAFLIFGGSAK